MNTNHNNPQRHELLAGYADGELSPADRATVEAWIAADVAAQAELEIQQRLSLKNNELWQKLSPPAPSEEAWDRVFVGVKERLNPATLAPSYRTTKQRGSTRWALAAAAIAALLVFAIGPSFLPKPDGTTGPSIASTVDMLQIVHADDVTIMSLQGDDGMLVIGRSPLTGPLDLVTVGDTEMWVTSTDVSENAIESKNRPGRTQTL